MAAQDALVNDDVLHLLIPLRGRWPDPRVLTEQDERFWLPDGEVIEIAELDPPEVLWLLGWLTGDLLQPLNRRARQDEQLTTSTALRRAMRAAEVPLVAETDPLVWLESTRLVRALRQRASPPG